MRIGMPTRILDRHVGGNTTYARCLADQLRASGHQVRGFGSTGNPVINSVHETVAGIHSPGIDLIHYVSDTGPLTRTRLPSVVTVHGVASRWIDTGRSPMQEEIWRRRVGRAVASCDRVITVSKVSASDVSAVFGIPLERIDVIYHGITHANRDASAGDEDVRDALLELDDYVLYLGNLEPRKNVKALVRAMDAVRPEGVTLVVAGKAAWASEPILDAIAASNRVVHLGFVNDAEREHLMRNCRLFVFPSLYEGFGLPVLEAMLSGVPVLCSDRGSLAEVAGPALRLSGLDEKSIAADISRALSELDNTAARDELGAIGRKWAETFTWESSATAHLELYRRMV